MRFIDEADILVESGNGGAGAVSFRREKYVPKGGPDGGNGGSGGDVIFHVDSNLNTLFNFTYKSKFKAENGHPGTKALKTGANGADVVIKVPPGTLLSNKQTGELIRDLSNRDELFTIFKGGRGGKGNSHFKSSTYQAPKFSQPGETGEKLSLHLELQLLADIGLIGYPNAGKSMLLSVISAARPKIANYPFTTLTPNLGVVRHFGQDLVIADIPGLIEGAHKGKGLGIEFLRHIRRTRRLLHLVDSSDCNQFDPYERFQNTNSELKNFDPSLLEKPQTVVLTKIDLPEVKKNIDNLLGDFRSHGYDVIAMSAATGEGLDKLYQTIFRRNAS